MDCTCGSSNAPQRACARVERYNSFGKWSSFVRSRYSLTLHGHRHPYLYRGMKMAQIGLQAKYSVTIFLK